MTKPSFAIKIISIAVFCIFCFHFLIVEINAQSALLNDADKKLNKTYFRLLESIANQPFPEQFASLQNFLNVHPEFETTYQKILDLCIFYEKVNEAQNYFQNLPKFSLNSHWVLAKIYDFQKKPGIALVAYKKALSGESPSFNLLINFITFYYTHFKKNEDPDLINLNKNAEYQKIVSGLIFYARLNFRKAVQVFNQLPKNTLQNEYLLTIMGDCYFKLRYYSKADSLYEIALKISRKIDDSQSEARLLMNLGNISSYVKKQDKKLSYFKSANDIANRINDWQVIQLIAGNRGLYYKNIGDFNAARVQFQKAFRIAVKFRRNRFAAKYGSRYAQMLYNSRDFNEAIKAYDESEKYAQMSNDPVMLLRLKIYKGDIYFYLNQNSLAKRIFQQVLEAAIDNNLIQQQFIAKVRLANVMVRNGEYKRPKKAYQNYIDFINKKNLHRRESEAYWLWKLAQTYLLEKQYDEARILSLKALESAKKYNKINDYEWSILRLAEIDALTGNYAGALKWYNKILAIVKKENKTGELSEIYLGIGNVYRKLNNLDNAIAFYLRAAEIIEKTRQNLQIDQFKIGYFRDEYKVYKNLVQCYLQRYLKEENRVYLDSLFYYDQMARGRTLQELKVQKKFQKEKNSGDIIYNQYSKACLNLRKKQRQLRLPTSTFRSADELNSQLSQIKADKYSVIEQRLRLVEKSSLPKKTNSSLVCPLSTALKNLNKAKQGLLLYNISEDSSFALTAYDSTIKIVPLQLNPKSLKASIDSLMRPFHNIKQDSVKFVEFRAATSYRLYKSLIKPVEEAIQLPNKLLIIADPVLMNLPFDMLLFSEPNADKYTPTDFPEYSDKFLLQRYSFSYAPSTQFLNKIPKSINGKTNFLIFANPMEKISLHNSLYNQLPSLTGWSFSPLPNSDTEANSIKKIVTQSKIIRHEKATKTNFLKEAPNQQFIHLATHGFVDLTFDAFSGIVFATDGDSTDDGILSGYEISDLDLRKCDLITLSACETGRGKAVAGEGVLGLPRLFLGAGAKSVLMTLWKVDDKFTSELMPRFYKNLFEEKLSKAEALSKAKLELITKNDKDVFCQHPFYWASFCLFGEPRSSKSSSFPGNNIIFVISLTTIFTLMIVILSVKTFRTKKNHTKRIV